MLEPLVAILQEIEDGNAAIRESSRGLEGPMGNFSRIVRHSANQLSTILMQQVAHAVFLGAPPNVLSALSATSVTTLDVEFFFRGQRALWPNPYVVQYGQSHALATMIEAAQLLSREPGTHSPPEAFTEPGTHSGTRLYSALKPGTRPETQGPKIRNPEPGTLHRAKLHTRA